MRNSLLQTAERWRPGTRQTRKWGAARGARRGGGCSCPPGDHWPRLRPGLLLGQPVFLCEGTSSRRCRELFFFFSSLYGGCFCLFAGPLRGAEPRGPVRKGRPGRSAGGRPGWAAGAGPGRAACCGAGTQPRPQPDAGWESLLCWKRTCSLLHPTWKSIMGCLTVVSF